MAMSEGHGPESSIKLTEKPVSKQLQWKRDRAAEGKCVQCGAGDHYRQRMCLGCWKNHLRNMRAWCDREIAKLGPEVEQSGAVDLMREAAPSKLGSYTHPEDVGNELKELARSVARNAVEYIPWRKVDAVEDGKGELILRLNCGHAVSWPEGSNTPAATRCLTCDPPTFRGEPFVGKSGLVRDEVAPVATEHLDYLAGKIPDPRD